ncbi:hypothetical protein RclHR1_10720007 [Rhizophagus clarus]|uniref:Protein kinase domain-containing protein n=1 Tax=Rhizophagus clarus TaxID=94130 RepID=A0A2Z6QV64_9GLOM|nr:hypothetical protein RclHR1_10720007 [Rhizophagus clarus]
MNLKKSFYWYHKATENNEISFKNKSYNEYKQPYYTNYRWCQQCNSKQFQQNFSKWTSNNKYIDKFIQETQVNIKYRYEVLEWIPYDKLSNINYHDKEGFNKIHKAIWLEEPIDNKLQLLKEIILGLKVIHESNLIHDDLHDGNIDLGLCKPVSDLQASDKKDNKIYGVVPYIAPEILRKKPYTPASDIYSFSMIMWEFISGISPFNDRAHDHQLIYDICKRKRPEIIKNTPFNRSTITELEHKISECIRCIGGYCRMNRDGNYKYRVSNVNNELKNDMIEFVKANDILTQRQANISTTVQSHSQAYLKLNINKYYFNCFFLL